MKDCRFPISDFRLLKRRRWGRSVSSLPNRQSAIRNRQSGFTLIELLITMAIIVILAGILLPTINAARRGAKVSATKTLIAQIASAVERYAEDWGTFPPDYIPSGTLVPYVTAQSLNTPQYPPESLCYYLTNANLTRKHPYLEVQAEIQYIAPANNNRRIIDTWRRPILYNRIPFPNSPFECGGYPRHNTGTFDVYSIGPNGVTNRADLGDPLDLNTFTQRAMDPNGYGDDSDDITNWK